MELIDIGANLGHGSFRDDLPEVLARARQAGLTHIMVTGTDLESTTAALALTRQQPGFLSATAGYHPHHAKDCGPAELAAIRECCAAPEVVAVGETGLDFHRDYSPRPVQLQVFEQQLSLAADTGKPLFLHQRDAHGDFHALLKAWRERISGGVVHCFTDSKEALSAYLDLDMHIGITGWVCDDRRGQSLQKIVRHIPANRLLIETDAPYLLPRTLLSAETRLSPPSAIPPSSAPASTPANNRNEPAYLPEVLSMVAHCRNETPEQTASHTTTNARRLFGIKNTIKQ